MLAIIWFRECATTIESRKITTKQSGFICSALERNQLEFVIMFATQYANILGKYLFYLLYECANGCSNISIYWIVFLTAVWCFGKTLSFWVISVVAYLLNPLIYFYFFNFKSWLFRRYRIVRRVHKYWWALTDRINDFFSSMITSNASSSSEYQAHLAGHYVFPGLSDDEPVGDWFDNQDEFLVYGDEDYDLDDYDEDQDFHWGYDG